MTRATCVAIAAATFVAACGNREPTPAERDPARQHRVIEPTTGPVRAMPPHAIRADGVGPYRLGESPRELVDLLQSVPPIALFEIPGVVHRNLFRVEDDGILVGGEPMGRATAVAVVASGIARTDSGVHVGSTRDELVRALGQATDELDHARDPRVIVPASLKNARALLDGERVIAIVIAIADDAPPREAGDACVRPAGEGARLGACVTAAGELIAREGEEVVVHSRDDHVIAQGHVPGLVFVAPARPAGERLDALFAVVRTDDGQVRSWSLVELRLDAGRLVRSGEPTLLYQLTAANARWIGAELRDLDLYLEVTAHTETVEVGGLLTNRGRDKLRDVVVISPVTVARHHP